MATHYKRICPSCAAVTEQCRCPGPGKTTIVNADPCDSCKVRVVAGPTALPPPVNAHVTEQAAPTHNENPAVWPLVIRDMVDRDEGGRAKYGTPLQPFNRRDALVDAYQEALDLAVYLRQAI